MFFGLNKSFIKNPLHAFLVQSSLWSQKTLADIESFAFLLMENESGKNVHYAKFKYFKIYISKLVFSDNFYTARISEHCIAHTNPS